MSPAISIPSSLRGCLKTKCIPCHSERSEESKNPCSRISSRLRFLTPLRSVRNDTFIRKMMKSGVLDKIRGRDFAPYSDGDLHDALHSLKESSRKGAWSDISDEVVVTVCAIVAEAINRRLGAWRIFDLFHSSGHLSGSSFNDAFSYDYIERYCTLAGRILRSGDYRTPVEHYTVEGFLESEVFDRSIAHLLAGMDLDSDDRTIVRTMVYVAEKSRVAYSWDIPLPADFYRALARKDAAGVLGFRVTDEQILAGILIHRGSVIQMDSGEGKTIAAAFTAVLHAVSGDAVHVVTANDYLACRDADLVAPVYESLGIGVGAVLGYMGDGERREAYKKQIVYGTLREFGFDFLRDNLKLSPEERVQRGLEVAIVDEADHALIDEARTPLIISGDPTGNKRAFAKVKNAVEGLIALQDKVALSLSERLRDTDGNPKGACTLLAKLLLAQPDNVALRRRLSSEPRCHKRVLAIVDQDKSDYPDSILSTELLYAIDPQNRYVTLTDRGQELLETRLGPFFDARSLEQELARVEGSEDLPLARRRKASAKLARQLSHQYNLGNQVYQMLRARLLLKKDVDYLVAEDSIVLIDKSTGRPRPDSRYQQGLQAALEAKEGVTVQPECEVLAQISVQGFVTQYRRTAGMTGTALASRDEFKHMYGLDVVVVPSSRPSMRTDFGCRIYGTRQDKLSAIVDEVKFWRHVGRPVLVGTPTIERSEEIDRLLTEHGVPHNLLNAANCHDEARIVEEAGVFGAVTVATNMAGRGTDIRLEPDLNARIAGQYGDMVRRFLSEGSGPIAINCYTEEEANALRLELSSGPGLFSVTRRKEDGLERLVVAPGKAQEDEEGAPLDFGLGLYVIGTELNHSARIDLQFKGRSGRQGEFGLTRFFLSLEDHFFTQREAGAPNLFNGRKSDPSGRIYYSWDGVDRHVERLQKTFEREGEAHRALVHDYTDVLDAQTLSYYRARRDAMESASFHDHCVRAARQRARDIVDHHFPGGVFDNYVLQFGRLAEELQEDYKIEPSHLRGCEIDRLAEELGDLLIAKLEQMQARFEEGESEALAKLVLLRTGDELWKDHFSRLQELMLSTQQGAQSHGAAVTQYVIHASREWKSFRRRVTGEFLSRLVTFPRSQNRSHVIAQPALEGSLMEGELSEDVAMVLV